jgi:hypothetical protein
LQRPLQRQVPPRRARFAAVIACGVEDPLLSSSVSARPVVANGEGIDGEVMEKGSAHVVVSGIRGRGP